MKSEVAGAYDQDRRLPSLACLLVTDLRGTTQSRRRDE